MLHRVLSVIAPHICCSCGAVGLVLCKSCFDDISEEVFSQCLKCLAPTFTGNLCKKCAKSVAYQEAYVVGSRQDSLKRLINLYKFERTLSGAQTLAMLADTILPILPPDTHVTFVPTISSHVRQRGYDHMSLLARELAKRRALPQKQLLGRIGKNVQHGTDRKTRLTQQKGTFVVRDTIPESPVLLIDDIYTTGATINEAVKTLRTQTTQPIIVLVIARQPLE